MAWAFYRKENNPLKSVPALHAEAGLSQAKVAALMGTKTSSVARLESALSSGKHSPSVVTLRKYARAVGKELIIQLKYAGLSVEIWLTTRGFAFSGVPGVLAGIRRACNEICVNLH